MAGTFELKLPGQMLERGFWLYVWRVATPNGDVHYVGRTGDNSSPNASAPYTRMGQHLGNMPNQNALRRHLANRSIKPETCLFHLIAHGPIYPEIVDPSKSRTERMALHMEPRNYVGAMEKALAEELRKVGYDVLNNVSWKYPVPSEVWAIVRNAFAEQFSKLKELS